MEQENLWNEYEKHLLNSGLTKNRIEKLKSMFGLVTRHITKPLLDVDRSDIETFINGINSNKIKSKITGLPLSGSTKSDVKKFLKQFFKHFKGKDEFYPPEVSWLKTKIAKDEKPEPKQIVSIDQIKKISGEIQEPKYRILSLILFDSGFRIDEALSVKKRNISWEIYDETTKDKCWWIECTRSKTVCRKIPVPIFTDDISLFMRSNYITQLGEDEYIWPECYENYLKILHRASLKILGKTISPHSLRHSSATYFAKLEKNIFSLCQRYGWSLSSNEAKEYVRMSGAYVMNAPRAVFDNQAQKIKEENEKILEENKVIKLKLGVLEKAIKRLIYEKEMEKKRNDRDNRNKNV